MIPFFRNVNATVRELWLGIVMWGAVCSLVLLCFVSDKRGCILGLWAGCLLAAAGVFHMWKVLDRALDMGTGAQKYMTAKSLLRYGVFVAVSGAAAVTEWVNPLTLFLGLAGMKAAAYLQPLVHKVLGKRG